MRKKKKKLLFLIRAFNDLDHFAPVIFGALRSNYRAHIVFTSDWPGEHYLRTFLVGQGAEVTTLKWLGRFHWRIRPRIGGFFVLRILDTLFGVIPALVWILKMGFISVIVEWGGISGRDVARYLLVAGRILRLPIFSLPHGYHIWRNKVINDLMIRLGEEHPAFDFSERNRFSRVIAQSENVQQFFLDRKVQREKLMVLGSPRFSEDWGLRNLNLALEDHRNIGIPLDKPLILFFLGTWDYRMNKSACFELVKALAAISDTNVLIKGHSRGSRAGGLTAGERDDWLSDSIFYAEDSTPSTVLIHHAHVVINYGSSIGIEAVLQHKPYCNASFLTENSTIFDKSGVAFDANSVEDVIEFVEQTLKCSKTATMTNETRAEFLKEHVYAGQAESEVLDGYLELFSGRVC